MKGLWGECGITDSELWNSVGIGIRTGAPPAENISTEIYVLFRYAGARRERVHRAEGIEEPPSAFSLQAVFLYTNILYPLHSYA